MFKTNGILSYIKYLIKGLVKFGNNSIPFEAYKNGFTFLLTF